MVPPFLSLEVQDHCLRATKASLAAAFYLEYSIVNRAYCYAFIIFKAVFFVLKQLLPKESSTTSLEACAYSHLPYLKPCSFFWHSPQQQLCTMIAGLNYGLHTLPAPFIASQKQIRHQVQLWLKEPIQILCNSLKYKKGTEWY